MRSSSFVVAIHKGVFSAAASNRHAAAVGSRAAAAPPSPAATVVAVDEEASSAAGMRSILDSSWAKMPCVTSRLHMVG